MTKIQVLAFVVALFQYVYCQEYNVELSYGTQATVTEPGQKVVTVPVFLLSEKKRKPRQRLPNFQKPFPQVGPSQSQVNNNYAKIIPFQATFPKPPPFHQPQPHLSANQPVPFPATRNVFEPFPNNPALNNFNGQFRSQPPSSPTQQQQHRHKPQNTFNKPPPPQSHLNHPPSPVPPYQTNFVKPTNNLNSPYYHKPVPPPPNFNKPSQSHNQRQKLRVPVQTLYVSAPEQRKPTAPLQNNYRKPLYSQSPQTTNYDKSPSTVYVKPPTSYTISAPARGPSYSSQHSGINYNGQSSSYNLSPPASSYTSQSSSPNFAAQSASAYNNPSNSYTVSSKPAANDYSNSNYASSVNYSPSSYSQPSSYEQTTYNTEILQSPSYSNDGSGTYMAHQSSYSLPASRTTQYSRPSSETTMYNLQDDTKTSESSDTAEIEGGGDDTTVSYKVVYIPLEVLKTILNNSGLK